MPYLLLLLMLVIIAYLDGGTFARAIFAPKDFTMPRPGDAPEQAGKQTVEMCESALNADDEEKRRLAPFAKFMEGK